MTATRRGVDAIDVALRLIAAAGLAVSAYIHLDLAHLYRSVGGTLNQGRLFVAQGVIAAVVALWVLVRPNRLAWAAAAVVGAASFAAVMVYRYTSLGAIGPIPDMHDGSWLPSPDKAISAIAEAVVAVVAVAALLRRRSDR